MREIQFHPSAVEELEQAAAWYESGGRGLRKAFLVEIEHAIECIRESPETWPPHISGTRRFFVHRFPFAVVYRYVPDTVQVLAVMHPKRRPGYWRSRRLSSAAEKGGV